MLHLQDPMTKNILTDRYIKKLYSIWTWNIELAHQPDEYIEIEDMIDSTNIMGNTLIDLLTN